MKTAILTDTNSGISVKEGAELGVFVIPMPVIVNGNDYLEEETITHAQLYAEMRAKADVSTSQPSPQVMIDMWDNILASGYDEVVYIPMSSGLSNACATAQKFSEDYAGKVFVVDNHRISVTLRDSVRDALCLAESGASGAEIKATLERDAYRSSIYIAVDTMEYLLKNGRCTRAAATIATVLNIKPVLTIQGGKLDAFKKVPGMKKGIAVMIDSIAKDIKTRFAEYPPERFRIGAAGTLEKQEDVEFWVESVKAAFPKSYVYYSELSCSIACHVGINAVGIGVSVTDFN